MSLGLRPEGCPETFARQSEVATFRQCPTSWMIHYYGNGPGNAPTPEYPTISTLGTLIHGGMAAALSGAAIAPGVVKAHVKLAPPDGDDNAAAQWQADVTKAVQVVNGWERHVEAEGTLIGRTTLGLELELFHPVVHYVPGFGPATSLGMYGSIDWLFEDAATLSGLVVCDHKSGKAFKSIHTADFQLLSYCWLVWKTKGILPVAGVHNKLRTVLPSSRSKPPYFQEDELIITEQMLVNHEHSLKRTLISMQNARYALDGGADPASVLDVINNGECGWRCGGMSICTAMLHGDDMSAILQGDTPVTLDN